MSSEPVTRDKRHYVVQTHNWVNTNMYRWEDAGPCDVYRHDDIVALPSFVKDGWAITTATRLRFSTPEDAKRAWEIIQSHKQSRPVRIIQRMETITEIPVFTEEKSP